MFRLNRNKQKTNQNSLIWSIFRYFFRKLMVFFGLFWFVSVVLLLHRNREYVSIEPKQTKDKPNSLIESIFWYFYENLGLFRFASEQFCLFRLFQYRFKTQKQTEISCFWFHKTNRNKTKTDLVSVCFGSNRNFFCLFRGYHRLCNRVLYYRPLKF
jgi:hypothetical protein